MLSVAFFIVTLSVVVLSVIMLSVIMLSVGLLNVVVLNAIMVSVMEPKTSVGRSFINFLTVPYLDSGPAFLSQMFWVKAKEFYSAHVLKKVCEYPPRESINQASYNGDVWSSK
jgi:hypothetical protein